MLFISILFFILLSLFLTIKLFSDFSGSKFLIVFFVSTISINILLFEILNFFNRINHPVLFLVLQFAIVLILLFTFRQINKTTFNNLFTSIKQYFVQKKTGLIETIAMALIALVIFAIGITSPINNMDSLHSHLPRIYYWLQNGSLLNWSTTNLSQIYYPINAHLQGLWLFLLARNESVFFLVQWFSMIVVVCCVIEIAKLLGFSQKQANISGIIAFTFPCLLLQAFSFQGDLIVSALILVSIFLFLNFLQNRSKLILFASSIPIAISIGTKQSAFSVIPILGITALVLILKTTRDKKLAFNFLLSLIVATIALSSYKYFYNYSATGKLFGEPIINNSATKLATLSEKIKINSLRLFVNFVNFDGLVGPNQQALLDTKLVVFSNVAKFLKVDLTQDEFLQPGFDSSERFSYDLSYLMSEDTSWFGPLSFLLLPLAMILMLFSKNKIAKRYMFFAATTLLVYSLFIVIQRPGWDPYQGRYFILPITILLPILPVLIPTKEPYKTIIFIAISMVSLFLSISILLFNTSKPLFTQRTAVDVQSHVVSEIPSTNRVFIFFRNKLNQKMDELSPYLVNNAGLYKDPYYVQLFLSDQSTVEDITFINDNVDPKSPMTIMIGKASLEYALFGRNVTREVYPIVELKDFVAGSYLIIRNEYANSELDDFKLVGSNDNYSILIKP